jgi:hypothetical protein
MKKVLKITFLFIAMIFTLTNNIPLFSAESNNTNNNINNIQEIGYYGTNIDYEKYPIEIIASYNKENDNISANINFNSSILGNLIEFKVYKNNDVSTDYLYNNNIDTKTSVNIQNFKFFEHYVFSIKTDINIFIGKFYFVYPIDENFENILVDLMMSNISLLNPSISLNNIQTADSSFDTSFSPVMKTIIDNNNSQLIYIENNNIEESYSINIIKGGFSNLQFYAGEEDEYIIEIYTDRIDKEDLLIKRFYNKGSINNYSIFFNNGNKIIKIIPINKSTNSCVALINHLNFSYNSIISNVTMLPVYGSPLPFDPSLWATALNYGKNCYRYAINYHYWSFIDQYFTGTEIITEVVDPGDFNGFTNKINSNNEYNYPTQGHLISALGEDAAADHNTRFVLPLYFDSTTSTGLVPTGKYKIALVIRITPTGIPDYHFYRQNPDGTWSSKKPGLQVHCYDQSNQIIYNPELCNHGYDYFMGYYIVGSNP